jgi:type IV pilus assembly protein PilX
MKNQYGQFKPKMSRTPLKQRGVVLFIALIVLVAMSLAGIGMMRSVDTGNLIAGNLAFKQATLNATDLGIETGFQWLLTQAGTTALDADVTVSGYSANPPANDAILDWTDIANWAGSVVLATDAAGNTTRYMIHRLCPGVGTVTGQVCAISTTSGTAGGGSSSVGSTVFTSTNSVYYRIMARVDGPRNTSSITEAHIQLTI